jgi:hypothetical protein
MGSHDYDDLVVRAQRTKTEWLGQRDVGKDPSARACEREDIGLQSVDASRQQ